MARDPHDPGWPLNPTESNWIREGQAEIVEDKLAWLIDTAKPEEPRYTPPSDAELESERVLSDVETEILASASSTEGAADRTLGEVLKWMVIPGLLVLVVLLIAVLGWVMAQRDDEATPPAAPAAQPGTSDGLIWDFTNTAGLGLYTISLKGDGASGATDVIEDATDSGTYTWQGDTLTISFTRKLTMDDGYVITDPWTFECTGTRDSTQMACDVTVQQWRYSGRDGFEVLGEDSWPAVAVPR